MLKMVRDTKRLSEILFAFAKNGFSSWIEQTKLFEYLSATKQFLTKKETQTRPPAERFRKVLEELGPTFVKLGQILSTRNDLLPDEWCAEFAKLQDNVPATPIEELESYVEKELGQPLGKVFGRFDKEPFAAASIAQVYSAELTDGTPVVVKVQRPGIEKVVETDLSVITYLAELAEKHIEAARDFNVRGVVREFCRNIRHELDYKFEERNMLQFTDNFSDNPNIYIPTVFSQHTTSRCLVIEKLKGSKIPDLQADAATRRELAKIGTRSILKQVFTDGLFHADPHPGNIFILEGNVIALIDFGMVGRADPKTRRILIRLLTAINARDAERASRILLQIGTPAGEVDFRELRLDIGDIIDKYYGRSIKNFALSDVVGDVFNVIREHRILMPVEYSVILKALLTVEKVAAELDGDFNFNEEVEPFIKKMFLQKLSIGENLTRAARVFEDLGEFVHDFPVMAQDVLRKLHEGRLTVEVRHKNIDNLSDEISKASSRVSFALVILALLVASSVMITLGKTQVLQWAGLAGYIVSGIMALILLATTVFRRRF